jgi:hypothetical protein
MKVSFSEKYDLWTPWSKVEETGNTKSSIQALK